MHHHHSPSHVLLMETAICEEVRFSLIPSSGAQADYMQPIECNLLGGKPVREHLSATYTIFTLPALRYGGYDPRQSFHVAYVDHFTR
jgi:hypothetical protein